MGVLMMIMMMLLPKMKMKILADSQKRLCDVLNMFCRLYSSPELAMKSGCSKMRKVGRCCAPSQTEANCELRSL